MATWIRDLVDGCSSPCETLSTCACTLALEVEPNNDVTWDVCGLFPVAQNIAIDVGYHECYLFDFTLIAVNSRVEFYADGVLLYDSGCTAVPISNVVTVPACTTNLRAVLTYDCTSNCESAGDGSPNLYITCG